MTHTVYIALGSNIGNRAAYLHDALDAMAPYLALEETSRLYETIPMLVTDQPLFLNAVCKAATSLAPVELLRALQQTEVALGRRKTIRYGPRVIDLDILFYDDAIVDMPDLTVPHAHIPARDFVLAPLLDLAPDLRHPRLGRSVRELWQQLNRPIPPRVMPIGERLWHWGQGVRVMGVLNVTPDSFAGDGLANAPDPVAAALDRAQEFAAAGADALDIGGYSTRPGHSDLSIEEEIRRVTPVIGALRDVVDLPLSIDTFRVEVAEAALEAGASWLNDVSGLRRPLPPTASSASAQPGSADNAVHFEGMHSLAARVRVPLVLMDNRTFLHGRGRGSDSGDPPSQSQGDPSQPLHEGDIVADVCRELASALALARRAGVARWHRIIDPGIGFGKSVSQHAALIARLHELQGLGYPLLFGCSRKGFLGKMAGGAPVGERLAATIAANVLAVERGAQIVRVHDVRENVQALRVVNAILGTDSETPIGIPAACR